MELRGLLWRKFQEMKKNEKIAHAQIEKEHVNIERGHQDIEKNIDDQTDFLMKELRAIQKEMDEHKYNTNMRINATDKSLGMLNKAFEKIINQNEKIIALLKKKRSVTVSI